MLYGRLEDETPFTTVRRFVEYEDYTLRVLGEHGFPTPEAFGIVEITPEREYRSRWGSSRTRSRSARPRSTGASSTRGSRRSG